jgi:succinoglycan biosynthesis transport protein ExoP
MALTEYLETLRRYWVALLVFIVVGMTCGFLYGAASPKVYESSTSVLLTSQLGENGSDLIQGSTYVQNLVATYVDLATSEKVLQPVIDDLNLDTTPRQLAQSITAESPLNTVLINLRARGEKPREVARLVDAVTDSLSEAVTDVSPRVGTGDTPATRLTTIESADVPQVPIAPDNRRLAALGALVGLVLGVGFALARRSFGSAITGPADVARVTDIPVVGEIVEARRGSTLPGAVLDSSTGQQAESLRGFTANLSFLGVDEGLRTVVVTSGSPEESKSSIASATALILAEASQRVLLIDADLRAPTQHVLTNLDNSIGLSSVLIGEAGLELAVQPWGYESLHVLTSGPIPPNPGQLLTSGAIQALIEKAEQNYDVIVIDSPPVLRVVDAVWLGHLADGVLLVARRGKTTPRNLKKALDILESAKSNVPGIVISRVQRGSRSTYGYTATT